jgi:hypothetical protein
MYRFNINIETGQSKVLSRVLAGWMVILLALSLSCSEDSDIVASENFDFDGTYILTKIARTFDGINFAEESPPAVGGILLINGSYYHRELTLSQEYEEENGTFIFTDGLLFFTSDNGYSGRHGTYDLENRTLTINYTLGDYLYTETWKLADPVPEDL